MAATIIPTSRDIYLEVDGKKVAVVPELHRPDHQDQHHGGGLWRK